MKPVRPPPPPRVPEAEAPADVAATLSLHHGAFAASARARETLAVIWQGSAAEEARQRMRQPSQEPEPDREQPSFGMDI